MQREALQRKLSALNNDSRFNPVEVRGIAIALVLLCTALAVWVGITTDTSTRDVDQVTYERTVTLMHSGESYYDAARQALVEKEGSAPSQVRSVRPPTAYLFVSRFPESTWRYLVAIPILASLSLAWLLASTRCSVIGRVLATILVAVYMVDSTPYLYLHAELWGLPFALGAVYFARRSAWWASAFSLAAAICVRELYAVFALLVLASRRRMPWITAACLVVVLGVVHMGLAQHILSKGGHEAALDGLKASDLFPASGPFGSPVGYALDIVVCVSALFALVRLARHDTLERSVLLSLLAMIALTVVFGRSYWSLVYGPLLVTYAPEAWGLARNTLTTTVAGRIPTIFDRGSAGAPPASTGGD